MADAVYASVNIQEVDDTTFTVSIAGESVWHIETTVTSSGADVEAWIDAIYRIHSRRLGQLIVGLDVEWRPNFSRQSDNPIAVIQLCIGRRCLLFQIIHADYIPNASNRFCFVGVGIAEDAEKPVEVYNLQETNMVDLRHLAADTLGRRDLRQAGLKALAREVTGMDVETSRRVTMSRWDNIYLTWPQISYACVDAFLSFGIGRRLMAG